MVTVNDELIESIKKHGFALPVNDVREPYSTKTPVYPMITVNEFSNRPVIQIHGEEKLSSISLRFEIYCRDLSHDGKVYTKRQVCSILSRELDEFLRKTYGFKRVGDPVTLPFGNDGTICRYGITYTGLIDNKTMIIYQ